ncbi:MAG: S41 family peptidase [Ignavibacteriales bacterium]|nr:S41 family peptidase [Ignavibacteriales bacterium]
MAVTRGERLKVMNDRYGAQPDNYDAFWDFKVLNDKTAYLKLGTFVTWKMKMDWEDFIENAFDQIEENKIPNVIIDIRGNGGGNDEVYMKLSEYMINKPIEVELGKSLLRYEIGPG